MEIWIHKWVQYGLFKVSKLQRTGEWKYTLMDFYIWKKGRRWNISICICWMCKKPLFTIWRGDNWSVLCVQLVSAAPKWPKIRTVNLIFSDFIHLLSYTAANLHFHADLAFAAAPHQFLYRTQGSQLFLLSKLWYWSFLILSSQL